MNASVYADMRATVELSVVKSWLDDKGIIHQTDPQGYKEVFIQVAKTVSIQTIKQGPPK